MIAIYCTLFKTTLAQHLQYRASLLIWLLGFILEPTVYMVVWITVAQSHNGGVGNYSSSDLVSYFLASMLINHLTFDWHFFEMEIRVRNGSFSPLLLRPLHPLHNDLAENITYKVLTFPFMFAAATALFWFFGPRLSPPIWSALLLLPALVMSFAMRFLMDSTVALAAFWTTRAQAVNTAYIIFAIFLSGRFAPLALLPGGVRSVAQVLPFRLWISFPIELLMGRLAPRDVLSNFAQQAIWIVLFLLLYKLVWNSGVRRYSAVGA